MGQLYMFFLSLPLLFSQGCSFSNYEAVHSDPVLSHVVLCWLKEPGNVEQRNRIIKMTESFKEIPGVRAARAGNPTMSERDIVDDSFDVGIIIEVRDEAGLRNTLIIRYIKKRRKMFCFPWLIVCWFTILLNKSRCLAEFS